MNSGVGYQSSNNNMSSVSSNAFDQRFKQNQAGQDPFGQASELGGAALGAVGGFLGKTWGFASSVASQATQNVSQAASSGQLQNLASGSLGFLGNVAKTSLNTAANVGGHLANTVNQAVNQQQHSEQPDFWNNFGQGSKSNSQAFSGFGGDNTQSNTNDSPNNVSSHQQNKNEKQENINNNNDNNNNKIEINAETGRHELLQTSAQRVPHKNAVRGSAKRQPPHSDQ